MDATLSGSVEKFTADPAAGQVSPKATATLSNGRTGLAAGSFSWDTDLPQPVGGQNQSPSPTAYLLGALAGCAVAFINDTLAPQFDVEITELTVSGHANLPDGHRELQRQPCRPPRSRWGQAGLAAAAH
ncbi:OsmC family protein [Georgenia sp. AZ-5]|uniref:OsmC family protein n=1 Tax=Georgenia sp. AZ-5 TaxID=3367526 RepID=UPI0037543364